MNLEPMETVVDVELAKFSMQPTGDCESIQITMQITAHMQVKIPLTLNKHVKALHKRDITTVITVAPDFSVAMLLSAITDSLELTLKAVVNSIESTGTAKEGKIIMNNVHVDFIPYDTLLSMIDQ